MTIKRARGDESTLLRATLDRASAMLGYYDLTLTYSIDIEDNSYMVQVNPTDLEPAGILIRLDRCHKLEEVLEHIVSASDADERERAIQRGRCLLSPYSLRPAEWSEG